MKRRLLPLLLLLLLLIGCGAKSSALYESALFDAALPESFRPVSNSQIVCFAPYGDPLLSSSITFYATESNWYFDRFTDADYEQALRDAGYAIVSFDGVTASKIDGFDARRIACQTEIDQGQHMLIVYAVNADRTYFFTLLNRDGDAYVEPFDAMMKTVHLKGAQ